MDFSKLYAMSTIGKRTALHVESMEDIADPWAMHRGEIRPASPVVFRFMNGASGSTAYDFVSTGYSCLVLISDRVLEVLGPFSGWTTYPVELYGKKRELIPDYLGLAVTGRCGPIDNNRSVPRICEPPVPQGRVSRMWFGYYFDEKTWDGTDIFVPEGTSLTCVTEAVKNAMEKARITNAEFTPLTECHNGRIPAEFL